MKPEDILRPCDHEFYHVVQKWEPQRGTRTNEELTRDANKAHDNIKVLVIENDRLRQALMRVQRSLRREQQWRNWLITALILTWTTWAGVVWWLSKVLAPVIVKGLGR